jgi:hypothetical protein
MDFSREPDTLVATLPWMIHRRIDHRMRDDWLIHDVGFIDA